MKLFPALILYLVGLAASDGLQIPIGDKTYECSTTQEDWNTAKRNCEIKDPVAGSAKGPWKLAIPTDTHLIKILKGVCGLDTVPHQTSLKWWEYPAKMGWEKYMYWMGARRVADDIKDLDDNVVSSTLYFPGEPSVSVTYSQNCIVGNVLLDNEHCTSKRKYVCEKTTTE